MESKKAKRRETEGSYTDELKEWNRWQCFSGVSKMKASGILLIFSGIFCFLFSVFLSSGLPDDLILRVNNIGVVGVLAILGILEIIVGGKLFRTDVHT